MHKNAVASEDSMRLGSTATICFVPILQLQVCLHLSWKDNATAWAALGLKPCSPCFFFAREAPKVQVKQGSQMVSNGISTAELWLRPWCCHGPTRAFYSVLWNFQKCRRNCIPRDLDTIMSSWHHVHITWVTYHDISLHIMTYVYICLHMFTYHDISSNIIKVHCISLHIIKIHDISLHLCHWISLHHVTSHYTHSSHVYRQAEKLFRSYSVCCAKVLIY